MANRGFSLITGFPCVLRAVQYRLLWVAAALFFAVSVSTADTYWVEDGGERRAFELALDQVHTTTRGKTKRLEAIPKQSNVAELRKFAETTAARSGSEVNLVLYEKGKPRNQNSLRVLSRRITVNLEPDADPKAIAAAVGAKAGKELPYAPGFYTFQASTPDGALILAESLRRQVGVKYAEAVLQRERSKRSLPNDPYFSQQWHLLNTGQNGATPGVDINVSNVWNTYRGSNVVVAVVDDGLEYTHPDIAPNANTEIDFDYRDWDSDPMPITTVYPDDDSHGTAVAGIIGARGDNGVGVAGVAHESTLVAVQLIGAPVGDDDEAAALSHSNQVVQVSNNSWGPADDGYTKGGAGVLALQALENNTVTGRGGKGTVYVWAGGNGARADDNANYDNFANSMYTIAVGALDDLGNRTDYSEPGACLVVSAPAGRSSTRSQGITTTDLLGNFGYNHDGITVDLLEREYSQRFAGTSASAPVVAGSVALLLQANPDLGWRDVQEILMATAEKNDPLSSQWFVNGSGSFRFNHNYGGGLVDVDAAVQLGLKWRNLPSRTSVVASHTGLAIPIPDYDPTGVTLDFDLGNTALRVEHVTVTVSINHPWRGDLGINLTSPQGTVSRLAEPHSDDGTNYSAYKFMSVFNWGEISTGTWQVNIADLASYDTGSISAVEIEVFGTPRAQPGLGIQPVGNGFRLLVDGHAGRTNIIQSSSDLATWTDIVATNCLNGPYEVLHQPDGQQPQFYRVLVP